MSNHHLITYDQLIEFYGFDPKTVKPYQVRNCLIDNGIIPQSGFNGRPCVTLEALNYSVNDNNIGDTPVLVEVG